MQILKTGLSSTIKLGQKLGLPIAIVALATLGACSQTETEEAATDPAADTYEAQVSEKPETLAQAAENPDAYLGETITVVGEVVARYSDQAFVIREEEYFSPDQDLLVLAADGTEPLPDVGEYTEITGEVQTLVVADLNKDYDIVLDEVVLEDIEAEFAEAPFLLAENIKYTQAPLEEE